jgi:hypothetical protein
MGAAQRKQRRVHAPAFQRNAEGESDFYLTNTKVYRIVYLMKVTAIIADDLVNNVKTYSRSSTVTETITIALKDWLDIYNIKELNKKISQNPIHIDNYQKIREMNRIT